jgi:hypothetical protein
MVLSKMSSAIFLEYTVTATVATSLGELLLAQRSVDHYTKVLSDEWLKTHRNPALVMVIFGNRGQRVPWLRKNAS